MGAFALPRALIAGITVPAFLLIGTAPFVVYPLQGQTQPPATQRRSAAASQPVLRLTGQSNEVYSVAFAPDGRRVAAASNMHVKVWDAVSGQEVFTYATKGTNVFGLAFSPDGKRLAVGVSKQVRILDASDGSLVLTFNGAAQFLFRLCFSPDGKQVVAGSGTNTNAPGEVCAWESDTGKQVFRLLGHTEAVLHVASSADGRRVASASGSAQGTKAGEIKVWEVKTGREQLSLRGHADNVYCAAFSPDGRRLASAGGVRGSTKAGEAMVWELASGKAAFHLPGHGGPVFAIAYSPDGRRLATAGGDKVVRLWDALSGQPIAAWSEHQGPVYSLAFSPDGKRLASGGGDRLVLIWDALHLERVAEATAPRTARELDALWLDLAGADAGRAFRSLDVLCQSPAEAVRFLQPRLKPTARLSADQAKQLADLIHKLDDERFEVRQQATQELQRLGVAALPAMRLALAGEPAPEVRRRLEQLLEGADELPSGAMLAAIRAVEVLERIGSPEAVALLKQLAAGVDESRLTQEAKGALQRCAP